MYCIKCGKNIEHSDVSFGCPFCHYQYNKTVTSLSNVWLDQVHSVLINPQNSLSSNNKTYFSNLSVHSGQPLWKKNKAEINEKEYNAFYKENYYDCKEQFYHDYDEPLWTIHYKIEGLIFYNALLFIPSHAPFDYYTKEYEKGLQLYSKGVLITDRCADLLPDHFNFVRGLVDSEDHSLDISFEELQHDHQLKLIAKTIEKKIKNELVKMRNTDREKYEKFFDAFGFAIKFGVYSDYGAHKDELTELLLFKSTFEKKYVTLAEYKERMKSDQDFIYYAVDESQEKIDCLPQTKVARNKGFEILYLTEYIDEFTIKTLIQFEGKRFLNICESKDIISVNP